MLIFITPTLARSGRV